jgi:hypothetical protein
MPRIERQSSFILSAFLATGLLPGLAIAQTNLAPELAQPLEAVNESSVTATIAFLACDELAGRDTPSAELNIASAYVAARFRGAGLQGGGDNGSFYQSTSIATIQLPSSGISIRQGGKPIQQFGLLSGDAEPFSYAGEVKFISAKDDFRNTKFDGPVYFATGKLKDRRAIPNLARQTAVLKRNGATAILIPVEPESRLVELAKTALEPSLVQSRGGFAGPTLLVSKLNPGGKFEIELPRQSGGEAVVHNVIGVLPGSDPKLKDEAIIFTAHLDHIGEKSGAGDTIFNGADDDASGVTAVVTLADAYAAMETPPKRTVIFMTFWGEEKGLLGSRFYSNHPTWPLKQTVANINIEMIGRPEAGANEKAWMTGWHESSLGELMNQGSQAVGILIFEHPQMSRMLYRASDNYSFVEKGVIGHSFSAGSLHADYHQVGDEWEKIELRHMTRVIQGLFAGSLPIANGEVTPEKARKK